MRHGHLLLGAALVVAACGGKGPTGAARPTRQLAGDPELGDPVVAVEITGVAAARLDEARKVVATKPGAPLDRGQVRRDLRALWSLGGIDDLRVEARRQDDGVALRFVVVEQPRLAAVHFDGFTLGARLFDPSAVAGVRQGDRYDPVALNRGRDQLLQAYRDLGFVFAKVDWKRTGAELGFTATEGVPVSITSLDFAGNAHQKSADLAKLVGSAGKNAVGGRYSPERLQAALTLVEGSYLDRGYVAVRVGPVLENYAADKSSVALTIQITEGAEYKVGKVELHGAPAGQDKAYAKLLGLKSGDVLSRTKLGDGVKRLVEQRKQEGHAAPQVTPLTTVDPDKKRVDLTIEISGT